MTYEEVLQYAKGGLEVYQRDYPELTTQIEFQKLAIEALEKQIAKKPNYVQYDGNHKIGNYHCPACEKILELEPIDHNEKVFCLHCGQAIDWSDDE